MKMHKTFLLALLTVGATSHLLAQSISGPTLGFVPDSSQKTLAPVLGIPGASMLGTPISFSGNVDAVTLSPGQDFALAVERTLPGNEDASAGYLMVVDFTKPGFPTDWIRGGDTRGDSLISISPSGTAAVLYERDSRRVRFIRGLPGSARVQGEIDFRGSEAEVSGLAVGDDGFVCLVATSDGMWAVDRNGFVWQIPLENPRAAAFLPNRRDAIVTDDATHTAYRLSSIGQDNVLSALSFAGETETFRAASISEDSRSAFLASDSGEIQIVDLGTQYVTRVSCGCKPTVVERLKGTSLFRLTESTSEPIATLDASTSIPRILLILPPPSEQLSE